MRERVRWLSLLAALACAPLSPLFAQSRATSADLTGLVRDESGAVVPGVRVTVTSLDTNLERPAVSGPDGRFDLPALPLGAYRVRLELHGFAAEVLDRVELQLGASVELSVVLHLAPVAEQITVTASSSTIDLQRTSISTVVSQPQIDRLPINGRNFLSFSLITPGAIGDRMPVQGASATSGLSFDGQRARSNNITVDGLGNNDETLGGVRATFSQEAVREFQVLTHSYSAEFGKASGGVVNIVTKSGTNVPAGTLFGYFRNDALNAKEHLEEFDPSGAPIDQPKAPYNQKQFGGVLGGPIKHDRTFLFASFERLDTTANNFVTIDDKSVVNVFGQPVGTAADLLRRAGFPIDTGHVPYDVKSNQFVVKVDHNIHPRQTLTLRYNYANSYNGNTEAWGGLVAQSRGASLESTDHAFAASHSAIISARIVNELRFQVASRNQSVLSLDPNCGATCAGDNQGGPTVEISGVASAGRNRVTPQLRNNIRYQTLDTISYQAGDHLWKAGIEFNAVDQRKGSLPLHFGGRYIFAPLPSIPGVLPAPVSAIQAFALGLPAAYVQGYGNPQASEHLYQDLSLFAQDQWRPRSNVTVNAGVRYQMQFWPAHTYNLPGYSAYEIPPARRDVGPRIGVAWDPTGNRRVSIHAAYGMYYDNIISSVGGIADLIDGAADGVRTWVLRFPQSVAAWNAPGRLLPEPATNYPSLIIGVDPGLKTSYAHHLSLGVVRPLAAQMTLSVNFVYVRGMNQLGTIDYNPLVPSLGSGRRPNDIAGQAGTSTSVLQYTSYGDTWYRGLTISLSKRLSQRLQFLASYVLSTADDNTSDFQGTFIPQDNGHGRDPNNPTGLPLGFDPLQERGPSQQDQRHRFVFSGSYEARGGVQLATIVSVGSGVPYNILAGVDLNVDGDGGAFPSDRARRDPSDPSSALARNAGRLPAEATVDLRASRRFRFIGKTSIEPIFEVFNLFNRVNYTDINNVFGVGAYPDQPLPTFGQFQRAASPRQAQVAARLVF